ncbi:MAG: hypothetical protein ACOC71_07150, partial [Hyphomicrobiales bacterium]
RLDVPRGIYVHMRIVVFVLLACILTAVNTTVEAMGYIQPPPSRYDKPAGNVSVQYASKSQIGRFCGNPLARGCAYAHPKGCTIIVAPGTTKASLLFRHERAHCNGWPKSHPR